MGQQAWRHGLTSIMISFAMTVIVGTVFWSSNSVGAAATSCYPAIFVFGDSLSDTGNGNLTGRFLSDRTAHRPYGDTFPGFPFARFSDGHLLVDFLALYAGLPLLQPSQLAAADFSRGVNYAVSGAAVLDSEFYRSRRIFTVSQGNSLDVQIARHLKLKSVSSEQGGSRFPDSKAFVEGLYVIAIAGNDYLNSLMRRKLYPPSVVEKAILPFVVAKIRNATEVLYANGARHFLIYTVPPLGCGPVLLSRNAMAAKDFHGCLRDVNSLSYSHGVQLQETVKSLRATYPDGRFIVADFYGAFNHVLDNKASYGLSNTLDACCGGGVFFPYRFNVLFFCNRLSSTVLTTLCPDPNTYISWDGIHFTDKFNSLIFDLTVVSGTYLNPSNAFDHCKRR